ncbi:hypothetical protein TH66_03585 [Carbonactinospora thermoautotrophica]|uniref:DUF397 domain-containing protein n=1 Tax=Carbonactinospora thermoautotrophica TaxID=1469144 RepID=A0A132MS28_9ACTN|nr:DUF397 domain-containing protein [Carbonactinospora thermoautotrophica]KWX00695.1 hypothetical protein LI90_1718 [Carbonactinospora thermoautotrophica]KWX05323.1 hypothetical protein TH66_03585 [Carbonactinospora thermoautotrophica]KWX08206.1 hypothetical protein TR74_16035 [Carbonactinospora thermoautotrophica]
MSTPDLSTAKWFKSSRSGNNGDCVEMAHGDTWAALRDSKNPDGPALVFDRKAVTAFLEGVKRGEFDPR